MPCAASAFGSVSRLYCGLVRERGTVRTSTMRVTSLGSSSAASSSIARVECPMVKNGSAMAVRPRVCAGRSEPWARIAPVSEAEIAFRPRVIPILVVIAPILVVIALGIGIPYLAAFAAVASSQVFHTPSPHGPTLPWLHSHHAFQLAFALLAIWIVKRFQPFDAGLRWPPGRTYIVPAV